MSLGCQSLFPSFYYKAATFLTLGFTRTDVDDGAADPLRVVDVLRLHDGRAGHREVRVTSLACMACHASGLFISPSVR